MKIIVINELKKYFDAYKIKVLEGSPVEPNKFDISLLATSIENKQINDIQSIIKKLTPSHWIYISQLFEQPLFHIVYFTDKHKYHSKGINVYAIDMASACEKFVSEFGINPFYCTVKEKEL